MLCRRYKIVWVFFNLHDSQRIVQEMNEDLLQVRNSLFGNRLLLNPDKIIVFGNRQMTSKPHECHLSFWGKEIFPVYSARDLGVILDPNLTFDNNITVLLAASRQGFKYCTWFIPFQSRNVKTNRIRIIFTYPLMSRKFRNK